jgi:hypothetical protein
VDAKPIGPLLGAVGSAAPSSAALVPVQPHPAIPPDARALDRDRLLSAIRCWEPFCAELTIEALSWSISVYSDAAIPVALERWQRSLIEHEAAMAPATERQILWMLARLRLAKWGTGYGAHSKSTDLEGDGRVREMARLLADVPLDILARAVDAVARQPGDQFPSAGDILALANPHTVKRRLRIERCRAQVAALAQSLERSAHRMTPERLAAIKAEQQAPEGRPATTAGHGKE